MPRPVTCPICQAKYNLSDEALASPRRIRCKRCDETFTVVGADRADNPRTSEQREHQARQAKRRRDSDPDEDEDEAPAREKKRGSFPLLLILALVGSAGLLFVGCIGAIALFFFQRPSTLGGPVAVTTNPKDKAAIVGNENPLPENKGTVALPPLFTLKDNPTPARDVALKRGIYKLGLLPDGKTAAVPMDNLLPEQRAVCLVDLTTGQEVKQFPTGDFKPKAVVVLPGGKTGIVGGTDGRLNVPIKEVIHYIDLESGKIGPTFPGSKGDIADLAMTPDGSHLALLEHFPTNAVRVVEMKSGREIFRKDKPYNGMVFEVAITPDARYVLTSGMQGTGEDKNKVIVWDVARGQPLHTFSKVTGNIEGMRLSNDGKLIAVAGNSGLGGSVGVWEVESGKERLMLLNRGAHRVAFGPQARSLLVSFHDGTLRVYDLRNGSEVGGVKAFDVAPSLVTLLPDGKTLVTAQYQSMKVWAFPESLRQLTPPDKPPYAQVVLDGKPIGSTTTPTQPEAKGDVLTNATIAAVQATQLQLSTSDGKAAQVFLQTDSRYYDVSGAQVPANSAQKLYRIGNVVTVKLRAGPGAAVAELRLVKEGTGLFVLANAKPTARGPNTVTFKSDGKDVSVNIDPATKLIDSEGKDVSQTKIATFIQYNRGYNLRYRVADSGDKFVLLEAREIATTVTQTPGAISVRGAVLSKQTEKGAKSTWMLTPPGQPGVVVFVTSETKAFDSTGKSVRAALLMSAGRKLDASYVADGTRYRLLEIREAGK